ncbi:YdcH family protein [Sphingomonas sp.]|uniref:YdcH family protein n=1 Tax=Sphingomonas sp. TaxID=28214 RepID=UPI0035BBB455
MGDAHLDGSGDTAAIALRLDILRTEHRDLDVAIVALASGTVTDQLQFARLKKRKLRLRDEIAMLEDQLIPDIIA